MSSRKDDLRVGIIGIGYVGLPLAVAFSKVRSIIAYDNDKERILELSNGIDRTCEVEEKKDLSSKNLRFTSDPDDLGYCNCFIITVPTPINDSNEPETYFLRSASELVGSVLKTGDIVIYESTVYPGLTEEICVPILEQTSGMVMARDGEPSLNTFTVGYSPERVNPGDKSRPLETIVKVVSASSSLGLERVDALYSSIIDAGTYRASSIKVAEMAKVIENSQRDLNIALVNEMAIICDKLGINTKEVLDAAGTKWNFLPFTPGLVGGHCIGVDPYYLAYQSLKLGHNPEVILSGRKLNDSMAGYAAEKIERSITLKGINPSDSRVLVLGLTFKENCPDIRNSKVFHLIEHIRNFSPHVDVYDPILMEEALEYGNLNLMKDLPKNTYDVAIIAVGHEFFLEKGIDWIKSLCKIRHIIFDLKSIFPVTATDGSL